MKLQQACAVYGLVPTRPHLAEQLLAHGDTMGWGETDWPRDNQFDELFGLLRQCGEVSRRFVLSSAHGAQYNDLFMVDYVLYVSRPTVRVQHLPGSSTGRPFLYYDGSQIVARLRFDLPDPLGELCAAIRQLLGAS